MLLDSKEKIELKFCYLCLFKENYLYVEKDKIKWVR